MAKILLAHPHFFYISNQGFYYLQPVHGRLFTARELRGVAPRLEFFLTKMVEVDFVINWDDALEVRIDKSLVRNYIYYIDEDHQSFIQ